MYDLMQGDCLEVLKKLPDNSIDAVVTDPPYELGFMGKGWDATGIANNPALWSEVLRVLKPGGHCVAFGGDRTYHRMACAIEDAGFEVRRMIGWVYGQGFPKSMNVSKAIDKAAGARGNSGSGFNAAGEGGRSNGGDNLRSDHPEYVKPQGITDAARQWEGWGTDVKPALEPICLARKPLSEKTVAANVLRWGTGAINVDGCRVEGGERPHIERRNDKSLDGDVYGSGINGSRNLGTFSRGRWPANLAHDGSQEVLDLFPETKSGNLLTHHKLAESANVSMSGKNYARSPSHDMGGDEGSAARFFYCAKASKADRAGSKHPTVKPIKLMQWLCRLITPPGGVVLDPFAGSGTTGAAAILEGFSPILIEREAEYIADIRLRLQKENDKWLVSPQPSEARCPSPHSRGRAARTPSLIEPTLF